MKEQDRIDHAIALAVKAAADASRSKKAGTRKTRPRERASIKEAKPSCPPVKSAVNSTAAPAPVIGQRTTDVRRIPAPCRHHVPATITPVGPNKAKPGARAHQKQHILSFAAGAAVGMAGLAAGAYAGLAGLGFAAAGTAAMGKIPQPASCALGIVSGCVGAFALAVVNFAPHHPHRLSHIDHASQLLAEQQALLPQSAILSGTKLTIRIEP